MPVRNGILTCFRQRGRTILFFLLLTLLTMALLLAQGVMLYCDSVLKQCDEQYRSIGVVEYMGEDYPVSDKADSASRAALDAFLREDPLSVPGVRAFSKGSVYAAGTEGYIRQGGTIPYLNYAVLVTTHFSGILDNLTRIPYRTTIINQTLFSRKDYTNNIVDLVINDENFQPEQDDVYVLIGYFAVKLNYEMPANGLRVFVVENAVPSSELPYQKITDGTIPERFYELSDFLELANNYIRVIPSASVEDLRAFHQNEIRLDSGNFRRLQGKGRKRPDRRRAVSFPRTWPSNWNLDRGMN